MDPDTAVQFGVACASIALLLLVVVYLNFRKEAKKDTRDLTMEKSGCPPPPPPKKIFRKQFQGIVGIVDLTIIPAKISLFWDCHTSLEEFAITADCVRGSVILAKGPMLSNGIYDYAEVWLKTETSCLEAQLNGKAFSEHKSPPFKNPYANLMDISKGLPEARITTPIGDFLRAASKLSPKGYLSFGVKGRGLEFSVYAKENVSCIQVHHSNDFIAFMAQPRIWDWLRQGAPDGDRSELGDFLTSLRNKARGETSSET